MSEFTEFPNSFECRLGVKDVRMERPPEGGIQWIYDPGVEVRLAQVEGPRYRAEVEGEPRPIRRTRLIFDQSEGGRSQKYDPDRAEGESVDLEVMMRGLSFHTGRRRISRGIELSSMDNWGHFRQWNFYRTTITLGEDGTVEVEEDLSEMDGSYY